MITYKKDIVWNIFMFTIIIESGICYFLNIPVLNITDNADLIAALLMFLCILLIAFQTDFLRKLSRKISVYLIIVGFMMLVEIGYSMMAYNQSLIDVLIAGRGLLFIFGSIVLVYFFETYSVDEVFESILLIMIVVMSIEIAVILIYDFTGISVVNIGRLVRGDLGEFRAGRLRYAPPVMDTLVGMYSFSKIINKSERKLKYYYCLLLVIIYELLIYMTRMSILALFVSLAIIYLMNPNNNKMVIIRGVFVVAAVFLVYNLSPVQNFLANMKLTSDDMGASTEVRVREITYYYSLWKKNPILGIGLIRPTTTELRNIVTNIGYAYSDIGFIGWFFKCSTFFLTILIPFTIRMFSVVFRSVRRNNMYSGFLAGLLVYFLMTGISLAVYDNVRSSLLLFYYALFEYYYSNSESESFA